MVRFPRIWMSSGECRLNYVLGDRRLGDVNAEFEQLAVNARRSPQNIRLAHLLDQRASLGRDLRSSCTLPALHSPKQPEAGAMPANDRIRFNNQYRPNRQRVHLVQSREQQAIPRRKLRPYLQLTPQRKDLMTKRDQVRFSRWSTHQATKQTPQYRSQDVQHGDRSSTDRPIGQAEAGSVRPGATSTSGPTASTCRRRLDGRRAMPVGHHRRDRPRASRNSSASSQSADGVIGRDRGSTSPNSLIIAAGKPDSVVVEIGQQRRLRILARFGVGLASLHYTTGDEQR